MVRITKDESKKLAKMGVPYGNNGISHTYSKYRHYYLCEDKRNMGKLAKIRAEHKIG